MHQPAVAEARVVFSEPMILQYNGERRLLPRLGEESVVGSMPVKVHEKHRKTEWAMVITIFGLTLEDFDETE